ncbi:MAG: choice-of-anchor J domain-containing protein [Pseudomonadota bacterium]
MFRKILLSAVLIAATGAANAGPITFSEGFDDVSALAAAGWLTPDNSTPGGDQPGWFQGNAGVFTSDSGADDSYIAANYLGAPAGGNIDSWLITPLFAVADSSTITFATRAGGAYPDTLEVLYSLGSSNIADFMSIGSLSGSNFPIDWANVNLVAYSLQQDIRLAFRYLVTDTSVNGDYVGIDSFEVRAVPEPGTIALFGAALLMMTFAIRRRRNQI